MARFRTKARAIELLGKGQIADLPTAISELWKNGYDAYAGKLTCNLYLPGYKGNNFPFFTLTDDGSGMSEKDILEKWIVLGTDSKARGRSFLTEKERFGKPSRVPMGEKGIGRLSVAYLGSPMLMLTKKQGEVCQLLFMDWRILENYNLFVDDINIPLKEFAEPEGFRQDFTGMLAEFLTNFDNEQWTEQPELMDVIRKDVRSLVVPEFVFEAILPDFLRPEYHGTTFLIFKPNEQLLELADAGKDTGDGSDAVTEIRRSLSGLYNVFKNFPDFATEFNVVDAGGKYNIINDFFSQEDFQSADHYIRGTFDENGFFTGTVRVFNESFDYKFRPVRLPGRTPYGVLSLELGVLEGTPNSSKLVPEVYQRMSGKTEKFGGLYIYRDDFRVLPYGRVDYDFLKFEERRTKGAGYYFFSHRNMFGYIAISRESNRNLIDKAGREGLIENKAYREFKNDLIQLFVDLAMTYFKSISKENPEVNSRSEQLKEIQARNKKIQEAEKKKAKHTKSRFIEELKNNRGRIIQLQEEINELQKRLTAETAKLELVYNDYNELVFLLEEKKAELRRLRLNKPQAAKLSELQEKKFEDYRTEYARTEILMKECEEEVAKVRQRFDVQNLQRDYEERYRAEMKGIDAYIVACRKRFNAVSGKFDSLFREEQNTFVRLFEEQVQTGIPEVPKTREDFEQAINVVLATGEEVKNQAEQKFSAFLNHVENLNFEVDDDLLTNWYMEQKEKLEDKLSMTNELAQLGISVEIIDHEFNVLYAKMAQSVNFLRDYAGEHPEIQDICSQLQISFQHMEANYKMLKPLYRTTRRQRTEFTGAYVLSGMQAFFSEKLRQYQIDLKGCPAFLGYTFFSYESVITSVFINVINNALYWLIPVEDRKIRIDYRPATEEILVMNNGERIDDRILDDIFTLFFTRKREGRGIGLYLARMILRSVGLDILASNEQNDNKLGGACFIIRPYKEELC